jgi:ubiquinone/menaquinone biosynthesis C-methylase UbiE
VSLRRQLARPRGLAGLFAGELLARSNRAVNEWTLRLLAPAAEDRVLEVGFGPGIGIRLAAARVPAGLVAGVDPSSMMLRLARWRNRRALRRGRVDLRRGVAQALPWDAAVFTHAFAVNSFFEWPDTPAALAELARVLAPDGLLALTIQARWARTEAAAAADVGRALALLGRAGFGELRTEREVFGRLPAVCLLGRRAA